MATLCLHCDATLTPKDLRDGWCDSCGKKVPPSQAAEARRAAPRELAKPADDEPMSVGAILLAVALVVVLTYFGTMAYLGDRGSMALLKIGVKAMVIVLIAVPVALFRMLRARA
jgi:hypothetical protein